MAQIHLAGSVSGAKALDAEFFAADIAPVVDSLYASKLRIDLAIDDTTQNLEYTLDSGSTWIILAEIADYVNDKTFQKTVAVRNGDTFNVRSKVVAGITIRHCRVDEVISEG